MGDRASISFVDYNKDGTIWDESVSLFSHWGGFDFVTKASEFAKVLKDDEPCFAMVEFIRSLPKDYSVYLGKNDKSGDNSDNGHWYIEVITGIVKRKI